MEMTVKLLFQKDRVDSVIFWICVPYGSRHTREDSSVVLCLAVRVEESKASCLKENVLRSRSVAVLGMNLELLILSRGFELCLEDTTEGQAVILVNKEG